MRAFEAAARHESFVAAAEELSVTPGAVSQHIKTLEGWSGVDLFRRNAQRIELTAAGRSLVANFTIAFDALSIAAADLRNLKVHADIHIAALPSIAQLWLPSRLGKIRQRFPEFKFSVTAMETPPNLDRELFDFALFFEVPGDNNDQIVLAQDEIVPVCAPFLASGVSKLEHLNELPLLHDQTWKDDWAIWSQCVGADLGDVSSGPTYSLYSLAVAEAKAGAGALIGHLDLIEEPLREGTLVKLHGTAVSTGRSLILTLPRTPSRRPEIAEVAKILRG